MKHYLKLTGLMISALLCLFTSCSTDDDGNGNEPTGVASVQVDVLAAAETLEFVDGSFVVTFSPSGQTKEISANDIIFAFDANPVTEASMLKSFKSTHVKKATVSAMCNRSDKEITVKSNLKLKQGTKTTEDVNYDFEVAARINYQLSNGSKEKKDYAGQRGIMGNAIESYVSKINSSTIVKLDIE